jgi:hypothetical protein
MKKLLIILVLFALSCNDSDPVPTDELTGTKWAAHSFGTIPGSSIYKVLSFQSDSRVQIDLRVDRSGEKVFEVGNMKYYFKDGRFYLLKPEGGLIEGVLMGDQIKLDTTIFERF